MKDVGLWKDNIGQSTTPEELEAETESPCGKARPWPSLARCFNAIYDLFYSTKRDSQTQTENIQKLPSPTATAITQAH